MAVSKIIIDTDAGIDDAMAISFAFAHPGIEVVGITSTFGNVPLETATMNALRLCEANGKDVPVCQGEEKTITKDPLPPPFWVHGKDGLGNINLPPPQKEAHPMDAVEFIAGKLRESPGEITLVPVGSFTNIAWLTIRHPEAVKQARAVVVMGGAAHVTGNVTPLAEFNIACDPEAADMVFGADCKVTMVGLDVTGNTVLTASDFDAVTKANPKMDFLGRAAGNYIDFYTKHVGLKGCCMHDVCAVAHVVEPDILTVADARIMVCLEGVARGKTAVMPDAMGPSLTDWIEKPRWSPEDGFPKDLEKWMSRPRHGYATAIDKERMVELFVETLKAG